MIAAMTATALGGEVGALNASSTDAARVLDVRALGAAGDGRTDDAPVFNSALASLADRGGGVLLVPPGDYGLGTAVRLSGTGIEILGSGRQASVLRPLVTMPAAVIIGTEGRPVYRWAMRNLRIEDRLDVAEIGVLLSYGREGILDEVWVNRGCKGGAVVLHGTGNGGNWTVRMVRCAITNGSGDGVVVGAQSNALILDGCQFAQCTGTHLRVIQATGVRVLACQFEQARSGHEITIDLTKPWSRVAGLDVSDGYFELLRETPGARALGLTGRGRWPVMGVVFTRNYVWGGMNADYGVELVAPPGRIFGALAHNTVIGVRIAGALLGAGVSQREIEVQGGWVSQSLGGGPDLPVTGR